LPRYALARRTLYCQLRGLPENNKRKYSWSEARQKDVPQIITRRLAHYIGYEFLRCIRSGQIIANSSGKVVAM
jgi:hypothetical protein